MPTSLDEARTIKRLVLKYLDPDEAASLTDKLNQEVGLRTDNSSLKVSLQMLHDLMSVPDTKREVATSHYSWYYWLTVFTAVIHGMLILANLCTMFVLPFVLPWYIALFLITLMVNLTFSPVPCPLTTLENGFRQRAGLPKIKGFLGHYLPFLKKGRSL